MTALNSRWDLILDVLGQEDVFLNKLTTTTKKISSYVHTCTYKHAHTSDFHLLPRYMARQVKHTPKSTSPEPPQVHTITFHSVTLPSHSVTFLNNYLSLHRHTKSSDDDYLGSGARKYHRPSSRLWTQAFYSYIECQQTKTHCWFAKNTQYSLGDHQSWD